jgi:hypothetical protein
MKHFLPEILKVTIAHQCMIIQPTWRVNGKKSYRLCPFVCWGLFSSFADRLIPDACSLVFHGFNTEMKTAKTHVAA